MNNLKVDNVTIHWIREGNIHDKKYLDIMEQQTSLRLYTDNEGDRLPGWINAPISVTKLEEMSHSVLSQTPDIPCDYYLASFSGNTGILFDVKWKKNPNLTGSIDNDTLKEAATEAKELVEHLKRFALCDTDGTDAVVFLYGRFNYNNITEDNDGRFLSLYLFIPYSMFNTDDETFDQGGESLLYGLQEWYTTEADTAKEWKRYVFSGTFCTDGDYHIDITGIDEDFQQCIQQKNGDYTVFVTTTDIYKMRDFLESLMVSYRVGASHHWVLPELYNKTNTILEALSNDSVQEAYERYDGNYEGTEWTLSKFETVDETPITPVLYNNTETIHFCCRICNSTVKIWEKCCINCGQTIDWSFLNPALAVQKDENI